MSIKFFILLALVMGASRGENGLLKTLRSAATFHDFKLDGLEATEDGGITLPPFRFMFPLDFRFFYHQVDFTSQNTTAYGLREAETNVSPNFSGDKLIFEGSINASRLFFVGDFVSNSYDGSPFIPFVYRYVGEDEYSAELKDLFVSLKFTLNMPLTGKVSITDY
ncbi:hypothetical protein Fcan01_19299 [Folsomia candida]|uniref:Uncharacterized protein n=1 Tax=Folsomia candida TaxID=158441 RepID=A0A226DKF6_FOLCA|nr:hypothetical protein Fcan01_19299 [Folsomia candida]